MSKLLKCLAASLPEIKNQQGRKCDDTCRVHTRLWKESKKKRKINDEKGDKHKKKDYNRQKTRHISVS